MKVEHTKLPGVLVITPEVFEDARGFFVEAYQEKRYKEIGAAADFMQDNHSLSVQAGTLRGLHYQLPPHAQTKLIRVTSGAVFDVAVDLRRSSDTFGGWISVQLSAENKKQLYIPAGFAHGFCTLTPNAEVQYKVDACYAPECERGIAWNDPELGIVWPVGQPILSARDVEHPYLKEAELFEEG